MTAQEQGRVFLAMMLCGVLLGAADTLLGLLRRGKALTALLDMLLGLLAALGVVLTALVMQCEAFRLYTLLGVAAGWLLYGGTIGTLVRVLKEKMNNMADSVKKLSK